MHSITRHALGSLARALALAAAAPALLAFALYPANGFLGYTYNKWGSPANPAPATVYWSLMPAGTAGSDYCSTACPGTSTLTLPNFYDWNTHAFAPVQLTDPAILATIRAALRAWGAAAGVNFVYLPVDSGVPVNDAAAEPPATGHIRIGVFDMGFGGPAAVGYAPPPNGFIPNSPQLATGAGDVLINSAYAYQNPAGAEGDHLEAYPQGGGPFLNDLQGLLLHEIGHALGIDHSEVADAVMCGWPHACIYDDVATYAINRQPGADDVAALRTLYGPPADTDGDGVPDAIDNCTLVANPSQCDSDGDGYGNRCDGDLNNNGATNAQDTTQFRAQLGKPSVAPVFNKADLNCNGAVNAQDTTLFRSLLGAPPGPSGLVP